MPGGETTQFSSYDNDGNLLQRIDGNGVVTNYLYTDPESLLTDIQYPASTDLNVHFGYDSYGRRASMTDSTGVQSYSYGNLDELLNTTTTYTGLSAKSISYSYHSNGSRASMTTPGGTFAYSYDAAGRPVSMTNSSNETTSWTYLNNDWIQTQTMANGTTATYTYNSLGQVTRLLNQLGTSTISDFSSLNYDGVGNLNSLAASIPGATTLNGTAAYTYDSKDQITQETSTRNGGWTDNFSYDSSGNPTSFKGVTRNYNSNNQQTGTGFVYDGNGNPTTYNGMTLAFDPENRMTAFGSVLTARYDGDGLRAWKQNGNGRTYFLYDGREPVVELDQAGAVSATNSFGAAGLVSRRDVVSASSIFYTFDAQGSVAQKMDATGAAISNHLFAAHGGNLDGSLTDPFAYKAQFGYYTDYETGLQLLTRRYYDQSVGRFLTRDPISYQGGVNLYSYVTNNPVIFVDPEGLAELYYWPRQGDSKFGHLALKLDDGTYISYWPSCHIPKDNVWKSCPSRPADEEKDRKGRRDPEKTRIDGLDEAAIKAWWNNGKGHGDWSNYNNCSDIVADALTRGGMPISKGTIASTPASIRDQVMRSLHDRQYPPPVPQPAPTPLRK